MKILWFKCTNCEKVQSEKGKLAIDVLKNLSKKGCPYCIEEACNMCDEVYTCETPYNCSYIQSLHGKIILLKITESNEKTEALATMLNDDLIKVVSFDD